MSIKQMTAVFNANIKPTKKLIMLSLADNANDSGICFPTIDNIVKKTSLSRQSVNDNLKALVEDGLLLKKHRNRKNGSRTSNKYLLFPKENFSKLDEEDYIAFKDENNQSQRDVPHETNNPKSERCTTQSQRDVLPTTTQSQRDVPLKSSLNNITITINHHLEDLRDDEVSIFNEYLELRKSLKIQTTDSIKLRLLKKYINFGRNIQVIENAISANWKDFYPIKQQNQHHQYNTPKSQVLNTDINIFDEIDKFEELKKQQGISEQEFIDG